MDFDQKFDKCFGSSLRQERVTILIFRQSWKYHQIIKIQLLLPQSKADNKTHDSTEISTDLLIIDHLGA